MCGIAGFFNPKHITLPSDWNSILLKMGEAIKLRGPDSFGTYLEKQDGIGFSHRRLAILDLSPLGHQPMTSSTGRFIICFNGEIYNHLDIRADLNRSNFKSSSDTETLLEAFEAWGIEETIKKTVGMFAIAIWDQKEKKLFLTRDRLGEKPLYYGYQSGIFLFGSEVSAITSHPSFENKLEEDAISSYLQLGYVPQPLSIYKGIKKLSPGELLELSSKTFFNEKIKKYWDFSSVAIHGYTRQSEFNMSDKEVIEDFEKLLFKSVKMQQLSDVPLGAFLSGGIDSSLIVSAMQYQSTNKIKTFTIGFNQEGYDEAKHAKLVAKHLGTEHTELYLDESTLLNTIPKILDIYCEPHSNASSIPTYLLSELTRKYVTVSLSGDGGDELFCGYNRYRWSKKILGLPVITKKTISATNSIFSTISSPKIINGIFKVLNTALPSSKKINLAGDKFHKLASVINSKNSFELYLKLISTWNEDRNIYKSDFSIHHFFKTVLEESKSLDHEHQLMFFDTLNYLPEDLLAKVDRAAMAVSLETRVPLLDHRIVEYAWKLPLEYKIRGSETKWLLRQILYKYVPKNLIERPKMGFSVPMDSWLRGPLKEWAENLIFQEKDSNGRFSEKLIKKTWQEHLSGSHNHHTKLWNILVLKDWLIKKGF